MRTQKQKLRRLLSPLTQLHLHQRKLSPRLSLNSPKLKQLFRTKLRDQ